MRFAPAAPHFHVRPHSSRMAQVVSIGCEGGGPETRHGCFAKVPLAQALQRTVNSTYTKTVDEFALVLRVSGSLQSYGEEGLANLRLYKSRRVISVDVQVPEQPSRPLSASELREYIARQVLAAVEACVVRLQSESPVQEEQLMHEVRLGIAQYLGANGEA